MTVISKLNQTLEMLKGAESNCRTFSLDTNDQNAQQMFEQLAQNINQCVTTLQSRINFVMAEEPQYQPQRLKTPVQNLEHK